MAKAKKPKKPKKPKQARAAKKTPAAKPAALGPGGRRVSAKPNVYTGLAALACVALTAACVLVAMAGIKVGPGPGFMASMKIHTDGPLDLGR